MFWTELILLWSLDKASNGLMSTRLQLLRMLHYEIVNAQIPSLFFYGCELETIDYFVEYSYFRGVILLFEIAVKLLDVVFYFSFILRQVQYLIILEEKR